ncbi:hypothetical protein L1887_48863 [Cichorium endivia]|nr:hypothetical protein L1887_48863 [Cichorium endivia]
MPDQNAFFCLVFSIRRFAIVLATRDEKKPEPKESDTVDESTGDYAKLGRGVAVHCCKEVGLGGSLCARSVFDGSERGWRKRGGGVSSVVLSCGEDRGVVEGSRGEGTRKSWWRPGKGGGGGGGGCMQSEWGCAFSGGKEGD